MRDVRMGATAGQTESHLPLSWLCVLALLTAVAPLSIDMYPAFPGNGR
jgi:MFS transporter, DHA1 family, multidrug resistance protein